MDHEPHSVGWLEANWPYNGHARALTTFRTGGVSQPPYAGLNLAEHVGDDGDRVQLNRQTLRELLGHLPVQWLNQVHGTRVVEADFAGVPEADGIWTSERGKVLAVLTADCLPVVLADSSFLTLAVVHGGWRGLVDGVLASACAALPIRPSVAWLGPAIGPDVYEVGEEVVEGVLDGHPELVGVVRKSAVPGKSYLDLFTLAQLQLQALGVSEIYTQRLSTWDTERFYSYRREGQTGRMATLAWLPPR